MSMSEGDYLSRLQRAAAALKEMEAKLEHYAHQPAA